MSGDGSEVMGGASDGGMGGGIGGSGSHPVPRELAPAHLPRSISYGDVDFRLTRAVISRLTPASYTSEHPVEGDDIHLFLHVRMTNRLRTQSIVMVDDDFQLEVGGIRWAPVGVVGNVGFDLQPSTTEVIHLAFPAKADLDFGSSALVIENPGAEPARLNLIGTIPATGYPLALGIAAKSLEVTSAKPCGTRLRVSLLSAEADVDARIEKPLFGVNRRADRGTRWVRLRFRVLALSNHRGGAHTGAAIFRLAADDHPRGPINELGPGTSWLRGGEELDLETIYAVEVDARELTFLAGQPGEDVGSFPLRFDRLQPSRAIDEKR